MVEETKQELVSAETRMETAPSAEADKGLGRTCGVDEALEVPEPPLDGDLDPATRRLPHRYRLSINLASIKDLENAAFVVSPCHVFSCALSPFRRGFEFLCTLMAYHPAVHDRCWFHGFLYCFC